MKNKLNKLYTKYGEKTPELPWNIYPRPLLKRNSFLCLNGEWDFEYSANKDIVDSYSKSIIVPFCPESNLSKLSISVPDKTYLFYRKTFTVPNDFLNDRVILNFGAVDNIADIFINGRQVGSHTGGYEPFSFDITDYLASENTLIVRTYDDLSDCLFPYGKQKQKRGGMWYTPVSGIWQTVWLESVPNIYIKSLNTEIIENSVILTIDGCQEGLVIIDTDGEQISANIQNGKCTITLKNPKYWSPERPYLYYFSIETDYETVESYFAFRTLTIENVDSIERLCLNGKPYYFHGILDQGYFCDGIFTPASPEVYTEEILKLKNLGFNMLRKHIKIEPQFFYSECDRLGIVVFQDMVNNGKYSFFTDTALPTIGYKTKSDRNLHKNKLQREHFINSMKKTVALLKNHPSICLWTIFNEGWGQFESSKMYDYLKELDPTRFIDSASGWFKGGKNDLDSHHVYFKKYKFKPSDKPVFLSEFGGYAYPVKDHLFNPDKSFGYKTLKSMQELETAICKLYLEQIAPACESGLCGDVYTQVSDVEDEINGLLTYDRKVTKVSEKLMKDIAKALFESFGKPHSNI